MTIVRRWTVTVFADGDRDVTADELTRLTAAVTPMGGVPTGGEDRGYGLQIAIAAGTRDEAVTIATGALADAARQAGLPPWPVTRSQALGDHEVVARDQWGDEYDEYGPDPDG